MGFSPLDSIKILMDISFVFSQKAKSGNAEPNVAAAMFVFVFPATEIVATNLWHIYTV
jgi:hypothetical protein